LSRQKTQRFEDNSKRYNVLEPGKPLYETIKGQWNAVQFKNDFPITLELGCGNGEYTIGLGSTFSNRNYIGIDIKGERIWVGSGIAEERLLPNVAFLRTQMQFLPNFFEQGEVDEIWLTFPDPRPKERDEKRRLSCPAYMQLYRSALRKNGWFRFKTDNSFLFDYTLEKIGNDEVAVKNLTYTHDLYQSGLLAEHHGIQTKYEKRFSELGETIKYMKFQFNED
jgi:tRNA (guanine-N7-)-methyltransferase